MKFSRTGSKLGPAAVFAVCLGALPGCESRDIPPVHRIAEAPGIVEVEPADGSTEVPVDSPVSVTFSCDMDRESAERSFRLTGMSGSLPGTAAWEETTLMFAPADPFLPSASYLIEVRAGAMSADGGELAEDFSAAFETAGIGEAVIFTEYVEGTSNNKALEIGNVGEVVIDLTRCSVEIYANGSVNPSFTIALGPGNLAPGEVYVLANTSFAEPGIADRLDRWVNFNGDDALALTLDGVRADVFGRIGEDPGDFWLSGDVSTRDMTLRRLPGTASGDTDGDDPFDPSAEWTPHPTDTFDGLGRFPD